jgi:hypothetical protein
MFINKDFFVEAFLSLFKRQARDGEKSGSGKPKLKAITVTYRDLIAKHKGLYYEYADYTSPKPAHAQQSAHHECTKINTAYVNSTSPQFGVQLRQCLNLIRKKKKKVQTDFDKK